MYICDSGLHCCKRLNLILTDETSDVTYMRVIDVRIKDCKKNKMQNSKGRKGVRGLRRFDYFSYLFQVHIFFNMGSQKPFDSDTMKELNNRFICYINKIRSLENQNNTLQGELDILKETQSSLFKEEQNRLDEQIKSLINEKDTLREQINELKER